MDEATEAGLVEAASVGGRVGLEHAAEFWDGHTGNRTGFVDALLMLQRQGRIRLDAADAETGAGLRGIFMVESPEPLGAAEGDPLRSPAVDPRRVFVVHGRDEPLRRSLFELLRALDLRPIEWSTLVVDSGSGVPYIGELLDRAFRIASAVVVLSSPDEQVELQPGLATDREPGFQARPNVIFEAGMALGRAPDRTVIAEVGDVRPFSDLAGRHVVRLDDSHPSNGLAGRHDLALRLRTIGCAVDMDGTDWHTVGRFVPTT